MVENKEILSAKGHAKNARNQMKALLKCARKDEVANEESIEYAIDEIKEALDQLSQ
jgi:ribosomal protein L17